MTSYYTDKNYEIGDVNLDGVINIMDVTYLQMYIASAHDLNKTAKKLSDVNGSGDSAGEFFVYIKFSSLMYPRIIAAISPICLSPSSGIASVETRV